jgi:hypothetical protein
VSEGDTSEGVQRQPREGLAMKRFGLCMVSLVFVVSLWAASAGAQDKFVMGYGGGT